MKTAAKVFLVIGCISGAIAIFPLVVGILAIKKLNTATKKEELTTMGVLALLFCNVLGGIFMLCIKDEDLAENAKAQETTAQVQQPATAEAAQAQKVICPVCKAVIDAGLPACPQCGVKFKQ